MKTAITKLALILLVGFTSLSLKANHQLSDVDIKLWNNSPFYIEFDYQRYNTNGLFSLQNITPGYHQVKIVQHFTNPNGYGGGHVKVLYAGQIHVPVASKLRVKVQPNHQLVIATTPLYNQYNGGSCGNGNYWNNNGYGNGGGKGGYGNNGSGYRQPYFQAMNEYEFNGLLNTLNNASFDNTRLTIANQAIMNNYLTVSQVKIIMNVFSFESNRLSFAKSAYGRTIDKQNYYLVNDAFSFSSSIHSLNNYISRFSG